MNESEILEASMHGKTGTFSAALIDFSQIKRRFSPHFDSEGRLRADVPAETVDSFVQEAFVKPARRLMRSRGRRMSRESVEAWMAWLNDQAPSWRLCDSTRRFCSCRKREALVSAIVRQSYPQFLSAFQNRGAFTARKKSLVEALRHAKKITQITGLKVLATLAAKNRRDCLFIIRRLRVGGIERALVNTVNALASLGRSVDMLVLGGIDPMLRADIEERVTLVDLGEAMRTFYKAAVNYSQWHFPEVLTRGIRAERKIQWVHSDLMQIFGRYPRDLFAREYKRIDRFVCVSESSRQGFAKIYPAIADRATTIYSFYDEKDMRKRAGERSNIVLPRDLPVAITVARLVGPKGMDRAVRIHKRLADEGLDFRWYLVGDGPMRQELEDLARRFGLAERFIFLGLQHNPFPIMAQADVFVLPSYHEGFPLSALEAMTLCMPMVLSEFGSAREIVRDGFDGLIARNNERCIAEALGRLIRDAKLRERLRANLSAFRYDNGAILASMQRELFPEEAP